VIGRTIGRNPVGDEVHQRTPNHREWWHSTYRLTRTCAEMHKHAKPQFTGLGNGVLSPKFLRGTVRDARASIASDSRRDISQTMV